MTNTSREHADLLQTLAQHRHLLRHTATGLSDEQARTCSTVSDLTIGGLIKHVTRAETRWADFLKIGTEAFGTFDEATFAEHAASFVMGPDENLDSLLAEYAATAARTDEWLASAGDLNAEHALPVTQWWPQGTRWSLRRAIVHIIAETAQHAGHADIIRESIDGQKSMG